VTRSSTIAAAAALALVLVTPATARAQDDDPAALKLAEPDFTLVSLPTSLRLPTFGSAFRVTHRFTRPLGQGDFGDLAADLFGIDSGASIGLEYRFGIVRNGQVGIHRTNNRTIEFFGQYDVIRQGHGSPVEVAALATIDGTNNFKDSHSPALGAIVSRTVGDVAAFYIEPIWVNNTNPLPSALVDHNDTFMVGVGARVRIRPTVYLVGEGAPRARGYRPGVSHAAFALEKRVGGHSFQVNFSDGFGTTMGQIARGGPDTKDWFLGFNISRKFF
jgi:uncharacterized beta barrel domain-containing protein DUF5777